MLKKEISDLRLRPGISRRLELYLNDSQQSVNVSDEYQ